MIKQWLQKLLARFIKPRTITEEDIAEDPRVKQAMLLVKKKEEALKVFAEHTTKKYGITLEDLKSDFNPGKIQGGSLEVFFHHYINRKGPTDAPYIAHEHARLYSHITREEIEKVRSEAFLKAQDIKKKLEAALKKVFQNIREEY